MGSPPGGRTLSSGLLEATAWPSVGPQRPPAHPLKALDELSTLVSLEPHSYQLGGHQTVANVPCLLRVEEALSPLQVALRAAAAVGRRQRSGVVPAVWSRWHTSRTTPGARDSTTRAARAMRRQPAFSGWPAQPRVSCSMDLRGCLTTPQDVSTNGDEQRGHCIARPSHAVAALLTPHVVVVRRLTACRVAPAAAQVDVLRSRWPPGVTRE